MSGASNGKGTPSVLRLEKRTDGVAIVWMDVPGEPVNTLQKRFGEDFERVFGQIESDETIRAVVFASAKRDNFLAGADVTMLQKVRNAEEAERLSRSAQASMNRLASFPKPVVAAIHGACLGGGLELAMACHGRVASDDRKTKLGLPEVQLGLLPGAGGTQRLPALVGLQAALDMMLTGRQVPAKKARKMGLVDDVVRPSILIQVAAEHALRLAETAREGEGRRAIDRLKHLLSKEELTELLLADNPLGRKLVFDQARKQTLKKTRGNYPAPERILEVVQVGLARGMEAGLDAEARAFGALAVSPQAAALMSVFFAQQAVKKDRGIDGEAEPRPVRKVGMLGAGLMGAGIAYVTAQNAGIPVRLKDRDDRGLRWGLRYVRDIVDGRVKKRRTSRAEAERLLFQVQPTIDYSGFGHCDVVIEAVFEDLALKRRVLREVEEHGPEEVIFASNTSSIPITHIAAASRHPETVIGMHYFSPVHKMPLLEIIVTEQTADWVTTTCVDLGKKQGKTVVVVRDGVGFYTTRILSVFMNEAYHVLMEGAPIEEIDSALKDFGFPVGPIKLTDEVGIDVGAKIGKIMLEAFGDRMEAPSGLEKLVEDDRKGRKNGRGFYRYDGERGIDTSVYGVLGVHPKPGVVSREDIAWRCALQMVNEAARCYGEGVLRSARDGDVGAVFGLGFPPFRGGPFRFVDAEGPRAIVERLERYQSRFGQRFEPAPVLLELARRGTTFHGSDAPAPGRAGERVLGQVPPAAE